MRFRGALLRSLYDTRVFVCLVHFDLAFFGILSLTLDQHDKLAVILIVNDCVVCLFNVFTFLLDHVYEPEVISR